MAHRKTRIVLYFPQQVDPTGGEYAGRDLLPLSLLTLAGWPDRDGYEVLLIDGNLCSAEEAHRRTVEACRGALLFATTGILGHQILDGYRCTQRVKAAHPRLPAFIGGWFASVAPELQLATGLYDAVCLGQGEITFRELVQAVDAGSPLEEVAGLALLREGQLVRTAPRSVVGWERLLDCPWHLLDIAPYRAAQLAGRDDREVERMPPPPGLYRRPFFGISYYSSFGCPEPCNFCCSPAVSEMRWKCMPAERMLDDVCHLHERWGFDTLRFYDANWGVMQRRAKDFAEGLIARDVRFWWYPLMQSSSIVAYHEATLDALYASGMYVVQLGAESGDAQRLDEIGKHRGRDDNYEAAVRLDRHGICTWMTYIIGFPGEDAESMLRTLDEARRITAACPLARANVWPFRPIPGTALYEPSRALGWKPPATLEEWADNRIYHMREPWPGQIPPEVARARRLYEHFTNLALGLARGRIGFWERRARRRVSTGDFRLALLEARAFDLSQRIGRRLHPSAGPSQSEIGRGYQTGVLAAQRPQAQGRIQARSSVRPRRSTRGAHR